MTQGLTAAQRAAQAAERVAKVAPSITELGKQIAIIEAAYEAYECVDLTLGTSRHDDRALMKAEGEARGAQDILYERITALRELITTMPALTLADAAVQVAEVARISGTAGACEFTREKIGRKLDQIERMMLAALPIVAAAAGLSMEEMDWADSDSLRVVRFAGVGVTS